MEGVNDVGEGRCCSDGGCVHLMLALKNKHTFTHNKHTFTHNTNTHTHTHTHTHTNRSI